MNYQQAKEILREALQKLLRRPSALSRARSSLAYLPDMSRNSLRGFAHLGLLATLLQSFLSIARSILNEIGGEARATRALRLEDGVGPCDDTAQHCGCQTSRIAITAARVLLSQYLHHIIHGGAEMLERVMGIEPTPPGWEPGVLPLNYTRGA